MSVLVVRAGEKALTEADEPVGSHLLVVPAAQVVLLLHPLPISVRRFTVMGMINPFLKRANILCLATSEREEGPRG